MPRLWMGRFSRVSSLCVVLRPKSTGFAHCCETWERTWTMGGAQPVGEADFVFFRWTPRKLKPCLNELNASGR